MRFELDLHLDPSRSMPAPAARVAPRVAHPERHETDDMPLRVIGRPRRPVAPGPGARPRSPPVLEPETVSTIPVWHADPAGAWYTARGVAGRTLVVPAGTCIRGRVQAPQVWVFGEVEGEVSALDGPLVVAAGGRVCGGVSGAGAVVVAGRIDAPPGGDAVVARGRLDIAASAHITGTVWHGVVALYRGARVDGILRALADRPVGGYRPVG